KGVWANEGTVRSRKVPSVQVPSSKVRGKIRCGWIFLTNFMLKNTAIRVPGVSLEFGTWDLELHRAAMSPFVIRLVFLGEIVQAFGDFFGFLAGGVGGELDDAVGEYVIEARGGEPAGFLALETELREDDVTFAGIGGRILLQQPRALAIELDH